MDKAKDPQGEAYTAWCKSTYVINELKQLNARLHHCTTQAEMALIGEKPS